MLVFLFTYFILMFIATAVLSGFEQRKTYKSYKDTIFINLLGFTVITLAVAVIKRTVWVFSLPLILWMLDLMCCTIAEKNIGEKERLKSLKDQEDRLYLMRKKEEIKRVIINTISCLHHVSAAQKKYCREACFNKINNAKNLQQLIDAFNDCQHMIEKLRHINHMNQYHTNYNNGNSNSKNNSKPRSKATSYTYSVDGALKLLKLNKNATVNEIKSAYRQLAKIHHPDRGGEHNNFLKLNAAYDTLRKHYNF